MTGDEPRVVRVNGPVVEVAGAHDLRIQDVVLVGDQGIPAETVALDDRVATLQAYEYTGGVRVGDRVATTGAPLCADLGPGLLGQVFDGLLRPLSTAPVWLDAVGWTAPASSGRRWTFRPDPAATAAVGRHVDHGTRLGTTAGTGALEHRVLVPPGADGRLDWLAPAGDVDGRSPVAVVAGVPVSLVRPWPVRTPRPFAARLDDVVGLHTGQRVVDALFPVAKGATAAVPGGFGTGKTLLLQQIAKWCDADVIVYVGCGERGNEMADVLTELRDLPDPRTGGRLLDRTVILANTSNMPMMAREASIHSGITVAEYYRDMGYDTVVIADSTSRWAEALREFASRTGALPAEEGYPAHLASAIASFYQRAGRVVTLGGERGSLTVIGAVSPAGGDLTEPVTAASARLVTTVWSLDRDLAYSRHYPAVSWTESFSRQVGALARWHAGQGRADWADQRTRVLSLLADADRSAGLAEILGAQALPPAERVTMLAARIVRESVLMQSALSPNDAQCPPAKQGALIGMALDVGAACRAAVARGVDVATLERTDFSPVLRARDETPPGGSDEVSVRRDLMVARLEELR
jgi:V/A-type H+/Na+-transporting ATPase subunit A